MSMSTSKNSIKDDCAASLYKYVDYIPAIISSSREIGTIYLEETWEQEENYVVYLLL